MLKIAALIGSKTTSLGDTGEVKGEEKGGEQGGEAGEKDETEASWINDDAEELKEHTHGMNRACAHTHM